MTPYIYAVDDFFPEYEFKLLREYALTLEYKDHVAPFDGVTYKNIGLPVPEVAQERLSMNLTWIFGQRVTPKHMAFRLSPEGSDPPQWAHSDAEVARFGMFVFMNDGPGGTLLLEHLTTGMRTHPKDDIELRAWQEDHNKMNAWTVKGAIDCRANRAVILRADLMHAAMPRHGFGTTPADGRLILLCFFD